MTFSLDNSKSIRESGGNHICMIEMHTDILTSWHNGNTKKSKRVEPDAELLEEKPIHTCALFVSIIFIWVKQRLLVISGPLPHRLPPLRVRNYSQCEDGEIHQEHQQSTRVQSSRQEQLELIFTWECPSLVLVYIFVYSLLRRVLQHIDTLHEKCINHALWRVARSWTTKNRKLNGVENWTVLKTERRRDEFFFLAAERKAHHDMFVDEKINY